MFRFVSIFFILAIGAAGYFFYTTGSFLPDGKEEIVKSPDPKPASVETPRDNSAQSTIDAAAPKLPELTKEETEQAQAHVESITSTPNEPIEIKTADHFVTAEQVLELPELEAQIVKIETVNTPNTTNTPTAEQQVDVIVVAPETQDQSVSVAESNQKNAQAAQSFAVKIPSVKKSLSSSPPKTAEPVEEESTSQNLTATNQPTQLVESTENKVPPTITEQANQPSVATKLVEPVAEVKVLATVTGTQPAPSNNVAIKVSPVKITPVVINAKTNPVDDETKTAIIGTLKKNLEEISDIKVSELANLVTESPKATAVEQAPQQKQAEIEPNKVAANTDAPANATSSTDTLIEPSSQTVSTITKTTLTSPSSTKPINSQSEKNRIKLKELLNDTESDKKRIFYLHAVNATDEQGIWGIIQKGLTGTFSKGISLPQANGTVRTLIPEDADEMLSNKHSSFLGKLLNYKVLTTYVYNYEKGNIGKNPDYIKPGQQLIIVTFTEQELMSIYQHFKEYRAQ